MQITLNANELDLAIKDYVRDHLAQPGEMVIGKVKFYDHSGPTPGPIKVLVELEPKP